MAYLIREYLSPFYVESAPLHPAYGIITRLYTRWRGPYLYLCATCTRPDAEDQSASFDWAFTRLEYIGGARFNLAYLRHTRQWAEVFQSLSLVDCLALIRIEELFHP